jgi:CheY-like chemotaxis protein
LARKILLADDSVTAQNMGRKILSDAGYEVVTVNNGSAALKKILEQKPDLIVLDVYMPGYSGLEVCQRVKENKETARIPVLLTVGKLEPFKPEEARRAKADAFVVKPFEASELLAAITRLEDKIVPQAEPYKQGRFAKAVAAVDTEGHADADESWKARLRIPTGPTKSAAPEVPEAEHAATQSKQFRDFNDDARKKQKSRTAQESPLAANATFERPLPAGLPADITPEEIAAITAAAERLKGRVVPAPAPESTPGAPFTAPGMAAAPEAPAEESAPVTFASAPEAPNPVSQGATEAQAGYPENEAARLGTEIEVPAGPAMAASEPVATAPVEIAAAEPAPPEAIPAFEAHHPEPGTTLGEVSAVANGSESSAVPHARAPLIPDAQVAAHAENAAPGAPAPEPAPADDEVMAALQSLMPVGEGNALSVGPGSNTGPNNDEMPAPLTAIVAELDSTMLRARPAGPRWIAEEVALAPDETTLSLQREMEQAYAEAAASDTLRASVAAPPVESKPAEAVAIADPVVSDSALTPQAAEAPAVYAMAAGAGDATVIAGTSTPIHESAVSHIESSHPSSETEAAAVIEAHTPVSEPSPAVAESVAERAVSVAPADAPTLVDAQIAEGAEDMVANWKNIRDSIASGAARPAPAKENEQVRSVELDPIEAQPVAAAPETRVPATSDPKAIASIVDSVLAELRPRIVEEIARKLADPKKD